MAMAGSETRRLVNLGGKSSSLSSTSVFKVANSLALVRIDSSAVSRLSSNSSNNNTHVSANFQFSIPNFLTLEEARASVLLFVNNLIRSSTSSNVDASKIADILNRGSGGFNYDGITLDGVSDCELPRLDYSLAAMNGMCALIDYRSSVLSTIADGMAALSCEALKADVSSAFNFVDSGDGSSSKDDVSVAGDLKVLLNGSKLVGANAKLLGNEASVSDIPLIHGIFREVSRLVHSRTRVLLNSPVVISKVAGKGGSASIASATGQVLATILSPLALALRNLGKGSRRRAELNLELMGKDGDLHSLLQDTFQKNCPGQQTLKNHYISFQAALEEVDYITLLHEICSLLEAVRKIVSWEAITAFASLEGGELIELLKGNMPLKAEVREENAKGSKKNEKRKKVLGKGTTVLIQFIKDNLLSRTKEPVDFSVSVNRWVQDFLSFLDPKDLQFEDLVNKVKDIVESNETRRLPKLPKGTRDFAKEQMAIRERAFSIIVEVFKRHGAMALDTPAFELRETLMGKYGEDSKLIYDLADQGGELCSLRYDLTVPFARYVAMNGLTSFKRYQIAKVYRRDNPSKGRYREFYQCDFDIAGQHEHMGPDFEVLRLLTELLDELKIGGYEVKLNHRKLLDGMMEICGVPPEKFRTICSSIDKLDKQPLEQIKKEMVEEKGLTVETAEKIGTYVKERGQPLELLSKLKQEGSEFLKNNACLVALNELEILFKALEKSRCIGKVVFDLSLARGLDYYTGVIFEATFKGATQVGSIAAGGRYDNLIGMFGTRHVPAVGVSLGIERVFTIMEQLQKDQNQAIRPNETQVLVSVLGDDLSLGAELVSELWDAKLKAEYMVNKRVMKHIDRAKDSGIPWMVIVGERELNEGIVQLKDVAVSKDEPVERTRVVEELRRRLNGTSN